ncbi:MAG: Gfo/Idh/MocA family oxidoreductase [Armatimonadetes bacterium]|nr:Gfo/Idh/MocA family oxidoreductase [Armatimonadota bacterium]
MPDNSVRLGYVGCGFVAQRIHIPNFCALPDCHLLALAEVRGDLGQHVARHYAIPKVYRSHEEIATDPDIEAVGVSAPYSLQGRIAEDLLRAGKHVFMEKPMAVSLERAESIVRAAHEGNSRLMVGYMKRYDPGNVLLKQHLSGWRQSGACGRIVLARNHGFGGNWVYGQDPNIPFEQSSEPAPPSPEDCPAWLPEKWRGPYLNYLQQWTHNINLLRFLLDDASGQAKVASVLLDGDGMTGMTVLDIGGVRAVVESAYTRFHAWEEHTQVYFEGGWLRTQAPALMHKESSATVEIYRAASGGDPPRLTQEYAAPGWSYREEAKHFLACLRSGQPFRSSGEDTLTDVRLYEDIYRAFLGM